jgi:hypothetical protein
MELGPCVDVHTWLTTAIVVFVLYMDVYLRMSVLDFKFLSNRDKTQIFSLICVSMSFLLLHWALLLRVCRSHSL